MPTVTSISWRFSPPVASLWGREVKPIMPPLTPIPDAMWSNMSGRWPLAGRLDQLGHVAEVGMAINTLRVEPGKAKPQTINFGLLTAEVSAPSSRRCGPARASDRTQGAVGSRRDGVGRCRPARQRFGAGEGCRRPERQRWARSADPSPSRAHPGLSRAGERTADSNT